MRSWTIAALFLAILVGPQAAGAPLLEDESVPRINWGDKPVIGTYDDKPSASYVSILFKIGVEGHYQGAFRDAAASARGPDHSQWWINCLTAKPDCSMKWLDLDCIIDTAVQSSDCAGDSYSTYDETIKITGINWGTGNLRFDVLDAVKKTPHAHIAIKMKYDGGLIRLESLSGYSDPDASSPITKVIGPIPRIDYQVPQQTYTLAPLKLRGWISEGEKKWDDTIKTLSPQDQAIWGRLKGDPASRRIQTEAQSKASGDKLRRLIPDAAAVDAGKRKLTPSEESLLDKAAADEMLEAMRLWFVKSGFSQEAQTKLLALLAESFRLQQGKH